VKLQARGICHSDMYTKEGLWPGIEYPRAPGHEVAGVIDAVGAEVVGWKMGQRVGIVWHGGTADSVTHVAGRILLLVAMRCRFLASPTMAVTPITSWFQPERLR